MKYQECNKIVKQKAFERAIASDEHKRSVVDSLDIENMSEWWWELWAGATGDGLLQDRACHPPPPLSSFLEGAPSSLFL